MLRRSTGSTRTVTTSSRQAGTASFHRPSEPAIRHGERYRQAFELFLKHRDKITRVTLWGVHDGASWLNGFPIRGRTEYALLFDRELKPKPAFFAVQKAAAGTR